MTKNLKYLDSNIYNKTKELFERKFNSSFDRAYSEYLNIKPFKASENIFETNQTISDEAHFILRTITGLYIELAFNAMKIDLTDPNLSSDFSVGNIGTPQRIAKVWCGANTNDDSELGSGRFMKPVRIATFPNTDKSRIPITKRVAIYSNCSHHSLCFSTAFSEDSYAIISYIPNEYVLGISKLQRLTDYVSRRFWLQEDLTKELHAKVVEASKSHDVFVKLVGIKHTCEWLRGAKNNESGFTSEYFSGEFESSELRREVLSTIR